jgi:beta-phosphoglucomutase
MFSRKIAKFVRHKKYPFFRPKAIFFDMDGVLFDSMKYHAHAWVQCMKIVGLEFSLLEAYMNEGRTGRSTIDEMYLKLHGRNASDEEIKYIYGMKSQFFDACGKAERMPYALELIRKIQEQNIDIFVVTGSGQPSLLDSLDEHFPKVFHKEKMVTAFDVKKGKPHPEPYLMALEKSGVQPWEVVVVENAPLGVESGNAAGLFTIAINTGPLDPKVLSDNGAHIVLDDMKHLYEQWDTFCESWSTKYSI